MTSPRAKRGLTHAPLDTNLSVRRKARAPRKDTPAVRPEMPVQIAIDPRAGSTALENRWLELCRLMQVPHFHDLDARRNVAGLPDGLCVVGDTLFLVEFKPEKEDERPAQTKWLDALAGVRRVVSGVVRPSDWEAFVNALWMAQVKEVP